MSITVTSLQSFPSVIGVSDIVWGNNTFLVIGSDSATRDYGYLSSNGWDWTLVNLPSFEEWASACWNGFIWVVVSSSSQTTAYSYDGITWYASSHAGAVNGYDSVAWNGTLFCAVGVWRSTCITSPDGINWTVRAMPTSTTYGDIASDGTKFVTMSSGGTAYVTTDCITWNTYSGSAYCTITKWCEERQEFYSTYRNSGNHFVTSPDGMVWTEHHISTTGSYYGATYGNGMYVVIASNSNKCYTSIDGGVTWVPQTMPISTYWNSLAWNGTVFVAGTSNSVYYAVSDDATWQDFIYSTEFWTNFKDQREIA